MWVIFLNIAFIKLIKKDEKNFFKRIEYNVNNKLNKIYKKKDYFFVYNYTKQTKDKIVKRLKKYDYALTENNEKINFPTLTGQKLTKYMIYEIYKDCIRKKDEITLCINTYSSENVEIIKDLANKIKVVNIVTDAEGYYDLEKILENQNIFITVSSNRRRSLKNVEVMVNFDFRSLKKFNFNRTMTIIDLSNKMEIPKSFDGKLIRKVNVTTKKQLRIFSDFENFEKAQLIEYQILKLNDYIKAREYINLNKIKIIS